MFQNRISPSLVGLLQIRLLESVDVPGLLNFEIAHSRNLSWSLYAINLKRLCIIHLLRGYGHRARKNEHIIYRSIGKPVSVSSLAVPSSSHGTRPPDVRKLCNHSRYHCDYFKRRGKSYVRRFETSFAIGMQTFSRKGLHCLHPVQSLQCKRHVERCKRSMQAGVMPQSGKRGKKPVGVRLASLRESSNLASNIVNIAMSLNACSCADLVS